MEAPCTPSSHQASGALLPTRKSSRLWEPAGRFVLGCLTLLLSGLGFQVAELEGVTQDGSMAHYPTMVASACRLLVAYSVSYRLIPRCSPNNPVCPPEPSRGRSGIRLAEVDLSRVDLSRRTLIPAFQLPENMDVNV